MSIEALMKLRVQGGTPPSVWVVVGDCPDRLIELPDCIRVSAKPAAMDWRAVIGLHVSVFDIGDHPELLDETLDAIDAAEPEAISVACDHGVCGLNHDHEMVLHRIRRHLANHS
jgi:hypothetical protein